MPIAVPAAGRRPYTIVCRDDLTATLVTREQRGLGHVLVIPVTHRETILDVTDEEAAALGVAVAAAGRAVCRAFDPRGLGVWQNNGTGSSQSVPHVHFHVAGSLPDGEGDPHTGTLWGPVAALELAETDAIADKLR